MLAGHGATVIMACRNAARAEMAADPSVRGGEYYGSGGWNEWTSHPERVQSIPRSHDADDAARCLWEISEQLTAVTYHIAAHSGPATLTNEADQTPGCAVAPAAATSPSSAPDLLPAPEKGRL
jgi:hypothetical protein